MGRIIEILKEFQTNSRSLSLAYLIAKFSLTIRTLQKDIQRINSLLSKINNCKIIKNKDLFVLIGDDYHFAINHLLKKFEKHSNNSIKAYQLLLYFIWENQPLSNSKLINLTNSSLYSLKQQLNLLNNFFLYYQLNLSLKFKTKKGWILVGSEQDLRILVTNILINFGITNTTPYPDFYLGSNLFHLFDKLKNTLLESGITQCYYHEIFYFLIVVIKRIKNNKLLNNYHCHSLVKYLVETEMTIEKHYAKLIILLQKNFLLKINKYEIMYLKSLMFFNQKSFNNKLLFDLIHNLKIFINDLIFRKYQFSVVIEHFKLILDNFIDENYLKLIFNFYKLFNINALKTNLFWINDSYFYGWEIISIISFAFKKFNINFDFNLFINNYFLINFNNLYLQNNQKNWIIPLYYQKTSKSYHEINKFILFIKTRYPNIILNSLNINNNFYKFNLLNKKYTLLLDNDTTWDLLQYKKVFLIKYNCLELNQQLESNIDLTIKMMMFSKLCFSILIFDFFLKQKFYSLKTFLFLLQNTLIKKFKINWINFDLKDAFIYKKFFQNNILLIHKLIPVNNVELPIILIYLKNPLFFHKKIPIHFIFILITNSNTLYQYHWMISYLNIIKNKFDKKINSIKYLYEIFNNSLSLKNLVSD